MSKEKRKFDLEERVISFAVRVIKVAESLPSTYTGRHLSAQIVRCGTSPAAHYGEAQGAESRSDFVHKMKVCLKEFRETLIWLRIITQTKIIPPLRLTPLMDENNQLISIFVSSTETARQNEHKPVHEKR